MKKIIILPQINIDLEPDKNERRAQLLSIEKTIKESNLLFQINLRANIIWPGDIDGIINWKTITITNSSEKEWIIKIDKMIDLEIEKYKDENIKTINKSIVLKLLTKKSKASNYTKWFSKIQVDAFKKHTKKELRKINKQWPK